MFISGRREEEEEEGQEGDGAVREKKKRKGKKRVKIKRESEQKVNSRGGTFLKKRKKSTRLPIFLAVLIFS